MKETKLRSWTKSLVWRLAGFVILGVITYIYTGEWTESLAISSAFNILRFFLYYLHERMWDKIEWGLYKPGDDHSHQKDIKQ
jgi:uncharacterized membrane protein